jgi:hypothetical protein
MTSNEILLLGQTCTTASSGNVMPVLAILAENLNAVTLNSLVGFNKTDLNNAVAEYAPPAVAAAYLSLQKVARHSLPAAGPAPTVDMTISEIYLEFRTSPIGSLSVEGALFETASFIAMRALPIYAAASAAGTVVNSLLTDYFPNVADAIGGTLAGMVDAMSSAASLFSQGQAQAALNALFGTELAPTSPGDLDICTPALYFAGGCDD